MEHSGNNRRNGNKKNWNSRPSASDNRRSGSDSRRQSEPRQNSFRNGETHRAPPARVPAQVQEEMQKDMQAIRALKQNAPLCPRCNQPITDITSALAERKTGEPVHFDCVVDFLKQSEPLKENEKITYIGQGRFAVVYFSNPHDMRHFTIVRVIEWEERDKKYPWRADIAGLYSQVH
ncbi:hypothetical protein [Treponema brennaborense]|uniref:Uncharacterized protein n=1 Tax=Treponema brennaborense (strain DSM 12168 / CIP 105900 / DD5/3) TaxID=906968 RepID=F4LJ91_TREBD|nr:hypothetical protein [Treponema brennaborense]AEE16348.1 hypothetical protein Trebr_0912 [Treponema brennaborense DSM 12168]